MNFEQRTKLQRSFRLIAQGNIIQTMRHATGNIGLCYGLEKSLRDGRSESDAVSIVFRMATDKGLEVIREYVNNQLEEMKV